MFNTLNSVKYVYCSHEVGNKHPLNLMAVAPLFHSLEHFFPSPMEDRFYEEDDWYFQFQDFKYTLSPELFPAMNISNDFLLFS